MDSVFLSEWWACISLEPFPKQLKQRQMMNDLARSALLFKLYLDDEEERTWMARLQTPSPPTTSPSSSFVTARNHVYEVLHNLSCRPRLHSQSVGSLHKSPLLVIQVHFGLYALFVWHREFPQSPMCDNSCHCGIECGTEYRLVY